MRSPSDIFDAAFKSVSASFKLILILSVIVTAISTALPFLLGISTEQLENWEGPLSSLIIYTFVTFVVTLFANISFIKIASNPGAESFSSSLDFAGRKILRYFGVSFVAGVFVFLGVLLFIVPGIYLAVALSFSTMIVLFEDVRGMAIFKRSREYVKGRWWGVLLRYLFIGLIGGVLFMGVGLLATIIGLDAETSEMSPIFTSVFGFLSTLFSALSLSYMYELYSDVRKTSSGVVMEPSHEEPSTGEISATT